MAESSSGGEKTELPTPKRLETLVHAITMLQDKIMKESVKDRRDTYNPESRVSRVPGTLPVTEGTAL